MNMLVTFLSPNLTHDNLINTSTHLIFLYQRDCNKTISNLDDTIQCSHMYMSKFISPKNTSNAYGLIVGVFSCSIFLSEIERDPILLLSVPQSVPEPRPASAIKNFDAAVVRAGSLVLTAAIPQAWSAGNRCRMQTDFSHELQEYLLEKVSNSRHPLTGHFGFFMTFAKLLGSQLLLCECFFIVTSLLSPNTVFTLFAQTEQMRTLTSL